MRPGALALLSLGGCQLVLGLEDPQPPAADDVVVPDADPNAPDADPNAPDADPNAPDAAPPEICDDPPAGGELWIRELMPDPAVAPDADGEWIELRATGTFDLDGVTLTDQTNVITFDGGGTCITLVDGDYRLLAPNSNAADNGGLPEVDWILTFALDNTAGRLELHHPDGTLLHFVDYAGPPEGTSLIVDDPNVCGAPAGTPAYNGTDIGTPRADNGAICP